MTFVDVAQAWDRQEGESDKQYAAFRLYKDTSPAQRSTAGVADKVDVSDRTIRNWAAAWNWTDRAHAWDDACHEIEDTERLEAIRAMHAIHRRAGRAAVVMAVQALQQLNPAELPLNMIARLLELGSKLERSTLIVSVEELQGIEVEDESEDAWERIARELDPASAAVDQ